jgi:Haemolysin-III related
MRSQTKTLISSERQQSLGEEIANSVSSGLCLLAIIAGIPFLFRSAVQRGDRLSLAGAIVFAASMVTLYLTSTVYHALPQSRVKNLFLRFDQSAIFSLHCGELYSFHSWSTARQLGLDAVRPGVGISHFRNSLNTLRRIAESLVFDLGLCWNRLDRVVRGSISFAAHTPGRAALDRGRRTRIHDRSFVLSRKTAPIRPLHLASLCGGRHSMSLLGRPPVRWLAFSGSDY